MSSTVSVDEVFMLCFQNMSSASGDFTPDQTPLKASGSAGDLHSL